jgi:hypothetical protein
LLYDATHPSSIGEAQRERLLNEKEEGVAVNRQTLTNQKNASSHCCLRGKNDFSGRKKIGK